MTKFPSCTRGPARLSMDHKKSCAYSSNKKKSKIRVLIQNPKIMEHRTVSVGYSIQLKRFSVQGHIVLTVGGGIRT
jgi:hypothetical protein